MTALPAQPNKSLLEGLEVLLAVAQRGGPTGVRELARELGMTPTRVQRYLGTLAHVGLTDRQDGGKYGLGPGIHALSAMSLSASGLASRAMGILPELRDLGTVVALGVLWRHTVNYLYFSVPGMPVSEALGRRHGFPARASSIGMLMLAWKEAAYVERHFPDEGKGLMTDLAAIRRDGFAVVHQPNGETSMAVRVGSPPLAGLAVSGKIRRQRIQPLLRRMTHAAERILGDEGESLS